MCVFHRWHRKRAVIDGAIDLWISHHRNGKRAVNNGNNDEIAGSTGQGIPPDTPAAKVMLVSRSGSSCAGGELDELRATVAALMTRGDVPSAPRHCVFCHCAGTVALAVEVWRAPWCAAGVQAWDRHWPLSPYEPLACDRRTGPVDQRRTIRADRRQETPDRPTMLTVIKNEATS